MDIDLNDNSKKIYFIGIGGISMSGLSELFIDKGFHVSGSDLMNSSVTDRLKELGATVYIGHKKEQVSGQDIVFYTNAVKDDNEELMYAKELGIPTIERAVLLGSLMDAFDHSIAVSGTHGKTTTTSMLSQIMIKTDLDPTVALGGILDSLGGNMKIGKSKYFIAEACEYFNSFLKLNPYIGVITNIDSDHLDFFKDIDDIRRSFSSFTALIKESGALVINSEIPHLKEITNSASCEIITFGTDEKDTVRAFDLNYDEKSNPSFYVSYKNKEPIGISLQVPGLHNIYNALAAIGVAYFLNIPEEHIISALKNFKGAQRRFQFKGEFKEASVYDDYAHHPTEIKVTLAAASKFKYNKLICVFQPHTYTRTKTLLNEFAESFDYADIIIISDIYAARESDMGGVHAKDLVERLCDKGKKALYIGKFQDVENFLNEIIEKNDLLITMGAGNVNKVGENILYNNLSTLSTELSSIDKKSCI